MNSSHHWRTERLLKGVVAKTFIERLLNLSELTKNDDHNSTIEWPSGPASSIDLPEVKDGCARSESGWATFQLNEQNSSLRRPSEGTST